MFIQYTGTQGDTKRYSLQNPAFSEDPIEVITRPGQPPILRMGSEEFDSELSALMLNEMLDYRKSLPQQSKDPTVPCLDDILGLVKPVAEQTNDSQTPYQLSREDRAELITTFKSGWRNGPTPKQQALLSTYNLSYEPKGSKKHGHIAAPDGRKISVSCTPKDEQAAGEAIAKEIIRYLLC